MSYTLASCLGVYVLFRLCRLCEVLLLICAGEGGLTGGSSGALRLAEAVLGAGLEGGLASWVLVAAVRVSTRRGTAGLDSARLATMLGGSYSA